MFSLSKVLTGLSLVFSSLVVVALDLETSTNQPMYFSFAISDDGRFVAGGTGKNINTNAPAEPLGQVILWDAHDGHRLGVLGNHGAFVNWMQFSKDGSILATASGSSATLKVWSTADRKLLHTFKFEEPVLASSTLGSQMVCALSKDGRRLAAVGAEIKPVGPSQTSVPATLAVWDTTSGKMIWSVTNSGVASMTFTPDGGSLLAYRRNVIWELINGFHSSRITDGKLVAWGAEDGHLRFTSDIPSLNPSHILAAHQTNALLALCGNTNIWFDSKTGAQLRSQPISLVRSLHVAALDPTDEHLFAIDFSAENVQFFRLSDGAGTPAGSFRGYTNRVMFASIASDQKRLAGVQRGKPVVMDLPPPTAP